MLTNPILQLMLQRRSVRYPDLSDEKIEQAMQVMDEGYLAQGYYRKQRATIRLEGEREETYTYDTYSWTEHISRKWGQWLSDPTELLDQLKDCGFKVTSEKKDQAES